MMRERSIDVPAMARALARGEVVEDEAFDQLYAAHVRRLSGLHWTPVATALRAAAWLAPERGMRVLDVGAGAGKLCCIGALARGGRWEGVERDRALVDAATGAAAQLAIEGDVAFFASDALALDWRGFDSVYFYNPFESVLFGGGRADRAGWSVFADQVAGAEAQLAALLPGARVVTFHGFGGEMPASLELVAREERGGGQLALWIQRPHGARAAR